MHTLTAEIATLQTHARLSALRPVSVTLGVALDEHTLHFCGRGHYHDYNEVFVVTAGACGHRAAGGDVRLEGGSVVFAPRGAVHCNTYSEGARGVTLRYLPEWLAGDFKGLSGEQRRLAPFLAPAMLPGETGAPCLVFTLEEDERESCRADFAALARELSEAEPSVLYLRSALLKVLILFGRAYARCHGERLPVDPIVWRALHDFDACIAQGEQVRLAKAAEGAGMSPSQFSRLFKREVGHSPQEYCQHRRVQHACALLLDPSQTITEVAFELGFGSSSNFTAMFRKHRGMPPSEYRRRYASERQG